MLSPNESDFWALCNQAAIGIVVAALDGRLLECNPAFRDLVGLAEADLEPFSLFDFANPEDRVLLQQHHQALAIGTYESYRLHYRHLHRQGWTFWGRLTLSLVRDERQNPLFCFGMVEDATDHHRALESTRASQEMLHLVIDTIPLAIYWKDRDLRYLGANRVAARDAGVSSPEEIIGKTDQELGWPVEQAEAFRTCDLQVMGAQQTILGDRMLMHRVKDDPIWINGNKAPLRNQQGDIVGILGTYQDITQQVLTEMALHQTEVKYRSIFEHAVEGIYQYQMGQGFVIANPMMAQILGYANPEDLIRSLVGLDQLYVTPGRWGELQRRLRQGMVIDFQSQVRRKDGQIIWILERARPLLDKRGKLLGYEGTVEEISLRKQVESELERRDALLQGVAKASQILLGNRHWQDAVNQALQLLGEATRVDRVSLLTNHLDPDGKGLVMQPQSNWIHPQSPELRGWESQAYFPDLRQWYERLSVGQPVSGSQQQFSGSERQVLQGWGEQSILLVPIFVSSEFWGVLCFADSSQSRQWSVAEQSILAAMAGSLGATLERQHDQARILHQALHDPLTDLPNRLLFDDRLDMALAHANRTGGQVAVLFLDLDRFKTINDSLGHAVGDQLLQAAAFRFSRVIPEGDTLARWGGDEFTILLNQIHSRLEVEQVAQKLLQMLAPPIVLLDHELYVSASIGIALYPQDGESASALIQHADAALYGVKAQGRNGYQFYTSSLSPSASQQLQLESRLHRVLEWQELILHYQPLIELKTGQITGMEALVRWQHPELGLLAPSRFIPLAEETGLVVPIGDWVLRTACEQVVRWQRMGMEVVVAVNLSARQLQEKQFQERIQRILEETGVTPQLLELEITESLAVQNVELTILLLQRLREMGVCVSIDDFGTGYCSLSYLKRLPLDILKIDQSFIKLLGQSSSDRAIVQTVIQLGKCLNMRVAAEGVETIQQVEILKSMECDEIQGFLFSRPLPSEAASSLLIHNRSLRERNGLT